LERRPPLNDNLHCSDQKLGARFEETLPLSCGFHNLLHGCAEKAWGWDGPRQFQSFRLSRDPARVTTRHRALFFLLNVGLGIWIYGLAAVPELIEVINTFASFYLPAKHSSSMHLRPRSPPGSLGRLRGGPSSNPYNPRKVFLSGSEARRVWMGAVGRGATCCLPPPPNSRGVFFYFP